MGTTYLELVNKLLRRQNETEVTADNLKTARGVHAAARDAIVDAVNHIQNELFQLKINAAEHRMKLVPGVAEYPWPLIFKNVDWNSFYLVRNETYNIGSSPLRKINRDQWYAYAKYSDDNEPVNGRGVPHVVFESHGNGFGVSPSPDEEYTVCFRYYYNEGQLSEPNDECSIPSNFDYVIVNGALWYMKLFKDDVEQSDRMEQKFVKGIGQIRTLLGNRVDSLTDTRVHRSNRGFF